VELQGWNPLFFPQEDYGVPHTYELVVVVHPGALSGRTDERAFLAGLAAHVRNTVAVVL